MRMAKCIKGNGDLLVEGELYEIVYEFPKFALDPMPIIHIRIGEDVSGQFPADNFEIVDDEKIQLTQEEIDALSRHPDGLRVVADYNDVCATEADACGVTKSTLHHEKRARTLREVAKRIEESY
jgi:hypothetical protein